MKTERLTIRRITPDDYMDLYEYLSLEEVVKFEPYEPFTLEEAKKKAQEYAESPSFFAVCLDSENGKVIGNLYLAQTDAPVWGIYEIGYVFNPRYYGKGYATEAADALLTRAFEELNAHRVMACCNVENPASWRLMERLGMRKEAHFIKKSFFKRDAEGKPIWHDSFEYGILKDEWLQRRSRNIN